MPRRAPNKEAWPNYPGFPIPNPQAIFDPIRVLYANLEIEIFELRFIEMVSWLKLTKSLQIPYGLF